MYIFYKNIFLFFRKRITFAAYNVPPKNRTAKIKMNKEIELICLKRNSIIRYKAFEMLRKE